MYTLLKKNNNKRPLMMIIKVGLDFKNIYIYIESFGIAKRPPHPDAQIYLSRIWLIMMML